MALLVRLKLSFRCVNFIYNKNIKLFNSMDSIIDYFTIPSYPQ
jgi:hypothetical protein